MNTVFLSLGSNMGNRLDNLRKGIELLKHVSIEKQSRVYESEPMYIEDQPRFFNMVVGGKTALPPHELLGHVKDIEMALGREHDSHNQPRPLDIDILLYDDRIILTPELAIPHPRMHERAFVLVPLEEIAPFHVHPTYKSPVVDLLDELGEHASILWEAESQL